MIKKIEISLAQSFIDDLKVKLKLTRWPEEIEGSGWNYGQRYRFLIDHWQSRRAHCEAS